jgi:hypothetical protein
MAATMTKKKTAAPIEPVSFDEIARKRISERIEAYRALVQRYAAGEQMAEADLNQAAELMEQLGLPQYAFNRDAEAIQRHARTHAKWAAAIENEPASRERSRVLAGEIADTEKKLRALREEAHRVNGAAGKSSSYSNTLAQLAADHPQVIADIDTAVRVRIDELNRRRQIGGAE